VDVGHNNDAASVLAQAIKGLNPEGRVVVLLGMLADKDPVGFVSQLSSSVDEWWTQGITQERGVSANQLAEKIAHLTVVTQKFESPVNALKHALSSLDNQDILLVTGSFMTVEAVQLALRSEIT